MDEKVKLLKRLKSWEEELHKTGKGNLSKVAPKIIKGLREQINRRWPNALPKENNTPDTRAEDK